MPSLFVCLLLDKSFGIHWESNKTRASTTKYHQEPHEIVNRADTIVILSQLYCVQLRLRNGGPAKLAESSSRQIADAHLPNFRLLQDQIWWRPARAQCLTLGADEDRWAAPAAKYLLKRREQSATVTNEDRNRVQRAPLCHRSPVCQERRKKKTWLANAAGRASCVRFWSTVCCYCICVGRLAWGGVGGGCYLQLTDDDLHIICLSCMLGNWGKYHRLELAS